MTNLANTTTPLTPLPGVEVRTCLSGGTTRPHTTTPPPGTTTEPGSSSTTPSTPHPDSSDFRTSEGLRALLEHLAEHGWRNNPQAKELLEFAAERFAPLARKHGLEDRKSAV